MINPLDIKKVYPYGKCVPTKVKRSGSKLIKPVKETETRFVTDKEIRALPTWENKLKEWGIL